MRQWIKTINQYHLLSHGDRVLVGLSGGADSVALLHALMSLRDTWQLSLFAAHINHQLRDEAQADEDFVNALCMTWQIPLRVFHIDVRGEACGQTVEQAARRLRYECLQAAALEAQAHCIATAHNRDDNAETVLLNLIRGAGLKGLCGIPPMREDGKGAPVIRPLLETPRQAIEAYLQENNIPYRTDASNFDCAYTRNRIRHEILPPIEAHINPHARQVIARNALWLKEDEALLAQLTLQAFDECAVSHNPLRLCIKTLAAQPPALIRRVLRRAVAHAYGTITDLHAAHIELISDLLHGGTGREVHLPTGSIVRREYGHLIFTRQPPDMPLGFCYTLEPEQAVFIPELGKTARLTLHKPTFHCKPTFLYDKVEGCLHLRTRRPGDRIHIQGVGTRKLQDYFTDNKTPRDQRDAVPLLACGSEILWIMDKHNRTHSRYTAHPNEATTIHDRCCWLLFT
jgi:tRNA(Ile)-lysidine synthase